ncbi:MAG: hypothetical protein K2X06_15985 [Burkholderiales bacterium]|nr:hypothetical protein [Burkholderiales bacterium]
MNTAPPKPVDDARIPVAATLYLMSHYAHRPCPLIAHAIAEQLLHVSQSCTGSSSLVLQKLADTLLPQWRRIACGNVVRH